MKMIEFHYFLTRCYLRQSLRDEFVEDLVGGEGFTVDGALLRVVRVDRVGE